MQQHTLTVSPSVPFVKDAVEHFHRGRFNLHTAFPLSQRMTILRFAMQCLNAWHPHCGWHPAPSLVVDLLKPQATDNVSAGSPFCHCRSVISSPSSPVKKCPLTLHRNGISKAVITSVQRQQLVLNQHTRELISAAKNNKINSHWF